MKSTHKLTSPTNYPVKKVRIEDSREFMLSIAETLVSLGEINSTNTNNTVFEDRQTRPEISAPVQTSTAERNGLFSFKQPLSKEVKQQIIKAASIRMEQSRMEIESRGISCSGAMADGLLWVRDIEIIDQLRMRNIGCSDEEMHDMQMKCTY